jgi:hypothetical protein
MRGNAVTRQALADNCAQAKNEIMQLRLACETLAHTERIQNIARARGLQYPAASQIVIINSPENKPGRTGMVDQFLVLVRRSLSQPKG